MNITNAKRAIAVMQRVKTYPSGAFDMSMWFREYDYDLPAPPSEKQALECGTAACFLGWLALAPEIPEIFVNLDDGGEIQHTNGGAYSYALKGFLEISSAEAYGLCGIYMTVEEEREADLPKSLDNDCVTAQDVIDVLQFLINRYEAQQ